MNNNCKMTYKLKNKQIGLALVSWLIGMTLFCFFATLAIKITPVYFQDYSIKTALKAVVNDAELKTKMPEDIRSHFNKYLMVNTIVELSADKLKVIDKDNKRSIQLDYEVRKSFFGNIDLVLFFSHNYAQSLS